MSVQTFEGSSEVILLSCRSRFPTAHACFATTGFKRRVSMADFSAPQRSPEHRPKRCEFLWQMEPSLRLARTQTTRLWHRCSRSRTLWALDTTPRSSRGWHQEGVWPLSAMELWVCAVSLQQSD